MKKSNKLGRPPKDATGSRSSTLSIRLTPKMRFGLEMMSRLYHESIPDIISRAVSNVFNAEHQGLSDFEGDTPETNGYRDLMQLLWSERPSDQLANIAFHCKKLLAGAQIRQWYYIKSQPEFWSDHSNISEASLLRDHLATRWEHVVKVCDEWAEGVNSS